jgi:hypothetical protein
VDPALDVAGFGSRAGVTRAPYLFEEAVTRVAVVVAASRLLSTRVTAAVVKLVAGPATEPDAEATDAPTVDSVAG